MIYISSSCSSESNIKAVLEKYAENRIYNIELSGGTDWYPDMENDLLALKERYHLNYACHAYFPPPRQHFVVNLAACNDEIYHQSIDHYMNCIPLLKKLNTGVLSIHAGFMVEVCKDEIGKELHNFLIYDEKESYERFAKAYQLIKGECEKNGIKIYVENNVISNFNYESFGHKNLLMMTDYQSIMKMKEYIDFELLLDLGHLNVSAHTLGLNFYEECKKLQELAKWIHISQNDGVSDQHQPVGENSSIVQVYRQMQWNKLPCTIEAKGSLEELLKCIDIVSKEG